jgi:hypothetical protein
VVTEAIEAMKESDRRSKEAFGAPEQNALEA